MRDQDTTSGAEIQPSLDPRREVERRYLHLPPIQWPEFAAFMRQGVLAGADLARLPRSGAGRLSTSRCSTSQPTSR
jgi:hypothetical protein